MARRRRQEQAGTPALEALSAAGVRHTVRPYDHDATASAELGYGEEAARALGADPARVFKTLVAEAGDAHVLAVVPVAARLDLKALARAAGAKRAAMAERASAFRSSRAATGTTASTCASPASATRVLKTRAGSTPRARAASSP